MYSTYQQGSQQQKASAPVPNLAQAQAAPQQQKASAPVPKPAALTQQQGPQQPTVQVTPAADGSDHPQPWNDNGYLNWSFKEHGKGKQNPDTSQQGKANEEPASSTVNEGDEAWKSKYGPYKDQHYGQNKGGYFNEKGEIVVCYKDEESMLKEVKFHMEGPCLLPLIGRENGITRARSNTWLDFNKRVKRMTEVEYVAEQTEKEVVRMMQLRPTDRRVTAKLLTAIRNIHATREEDPVNGGWLNIRCVFKGEYDEYGWRVRSAAENSKVDGKDVEVVKETITEYLCGKFMMSEDQAEWIKENVQLCRDIGQIPRSAEVQARVNAYVNPSRRGQGAEIFVSDLRIPYSEEKPEWKEWAGSHRKWSEATGQPETPGTVPYKDGYREESKVWLLRMKNGREKLQVGDVNDYNDVVDHGGVFVGAGDNWMGYQVLSEMRAGNIPVWPERKFSGKGERACCRGVKRGENSVSPRPGKGREGKPAKAPPPQPESYGGQDSATDEAADQSQQPQQLPSDHEQKQANWWQRAWQS